MRVMLVLILAVCACSAINPAPPVSHQLILDIRNNRNEPLVVRLVPRLLQITGPPALQDGGGGEGTEVAANDRRTVRIAISTDEWTVTVNGSPMIRSDEHVFLPGDRTLAHVVVDRDRARMEMLRPEPMPSS